MSTIPSLIGFIPANVRYSKHLKASEKLLYCEITAICGTGAYCITDYDYLMEFTGCKESTVLEYLTDLEKCGFIEVSTVKEGKKLKISLKEVLR